MNRAIAASRTAEAIGADLASTWHSQALWFARCRGLTLTVCLIALGVTPANGQRRDEAPPAVTAASDPVGAALTEASTRFNIPRDWIAGVLQAESGGEANAVSAKGALGLMQLMPPTWQQMRNSLRLGDNAFDPHDNILAGAGYLRQMLDRYGTSGFLGAYNAGPGRYDEHLATGKSLPQETVVYMTRLATALHLPQTGGAQSSALDPNLLMFVGGLADSRPAPPSPSTKPDDGTLASHTFALGPHANGLFVGTPNVLPVR